MDNLKPVETNNLKMSWNFFNRILAVREFGIIMVLIFMIAVTTIVSPRFFSFGNLIDLLRSISFIVIIGVGMTFVIITAGIDLSIGSVLAMSGVITAVCLQGGFPISVSIFLGVLNGTLFGLINGVVIITFGIPPMIATLGTMYIARGIVNVITKGAPIYPLPEVFNQMGLGSLLGIPYSVYLCTIIVLIGVFILNFTSYGRSLLAVGGNEETARVSGINIKRTKVMAYVITGTLSGVVGVLMDARLRAAHASAGTGWEMTLIAAVIIGGTSLFGGSGTLLGTVIGASIMTVINNAMIFMRVSVYWQYVVLGIIIIVAVAIDTYKRSSLSRG